MNYKKLALTITMAVASLSLTSAVQAECSFTGKVENIIQAQTYAYIYVVATNAVVPAYSIYFLTYDADIMHAANDSVNTEQAVNIVGDAATCPKSGTYRYGGQINFLTRY